MSNILVFKLRCSSDSLICLPEKKLPAFPAEEEEMMLFSERVGEAQRLATMVCSINKYHSNCVIFLSSF